MPSFCGVIVLFYFLRVTIFVGLYSAESHVLCFVFCILLFFFFFYFFFPTPFLLSGDKSTIYVLLSTVYILFDTVYGLKNIKNGSTILFTHLKIILLQCFQFSVFNFQFQQK